MRKRIQRVLNLLATTSTRSGLVSLADQVVASVTNFLTGVIIGRYCPQEEFGLYMLFFSTILLVADIQMSLISAPYMVFRQRLTGRRLVRYNGSIFIHQVIFSLIFVGLLAIGAATCSWAPFYSGKAGFHEYASVLWILAVTITFILLRDYIRKVCFADLQMFSALLLDVFVGILQLSGLFFLAREGLLSAATSFLVIGVACGMISLGWLFLNRESFSFSGLRSLADFKKNWVFAKWMFLSGLLWALGMTVYPWFLTYFHGTAQNGILGACYATAAMVNPLKLGVQNFLGPKVVQAYTKGGIFVLWRFVQKATLLFLLIILPFCLVLLSFGDPLVVLIYGKKYAGNGLVVSVLALNLIVQVATFALSRAFLAIERSDLYFAANFVPLFVLLSAGLLMVKAMGSLGVALSLLVSSVITLIVMFILFSKLLINARERIRSEETRAIGSEDKVVEAAE